MTKNPMANAKTEDFRNAHMALLRAAEVARAVAKQFNTPIVVRKNGRMAELEMR